MKMQPITYRNIYVNGSYNDGEQEGFTPFKQADGSTVLKRIVEMCPMPWSRGAMLQFRLINLTQPAIKELPDGSIGIGKVYEQELYRFWIHDRPPQPVPNDIIIPSNDQALLISALVSQELRGSYAENITQELFIDLVVLNSKSRFKDFLPEVHAYHSKKYEKYGWEVKSK